MTTLRLSLLLKIALVLGFFAVAIASVLHTAHMMKADMASTHCPYTQEQPACIAGTSQSVVASISRFATETPSSSLILLLVILYAVTIGVWNLLYVKLRRRNPVMWDTKILFADGILNPKSY